MNQLPFDATAETFDTLVYEPREQIVVVEFSSSPNCDDYGREYRLGVIEDHLPA